MDSRDTEGIEMTRLFLNGPGGWRHGKRPGNFHVRGLEN